MKNITYLFASACVALGLASCDIDNVENMGELSTENFPVSEATVLQPWQVSIKT